MFRHHFRTIDGFFPVPTGVFLCLMRQKPKKRILPRPHGGVSLIDRLTFDESYSSPSPRGCFWIPKIFSIDQFFFPVPTGVFLYGAFELCKKEILPRPHGGVSRCYLPKQRLRHSSPSPRGCFRSGNHRRMWMHFFPVPTGVFLMSIPQPIQTRLLPRPHGGVSDLGKKDYILEDSSPSPRGCFCLSLGDYGREKFFPVPTGVFPVCIARGLEEPLLPRPHGGVSHPYNTSDINIHSSPSPRGCF